MAGFQRGFKSSKTNLIRLLNSTCRFVNHPHIQDVKGWKEEERWGGTGKTKERVRSVYIIHDIAAYASHEALNWWPCYCRKETIILWLQAVGNYYHHGKKQSTEALQFGRMPHACRAACHYTELKKSEDEEKAIRTRTQKNRTLLVC